MGIPAHDAVSSLKFPHTSRNHQFLGLTLSIINLLIKQYLSHNLFSNEKTSLILDLHGNAQGAPSINSFPKQLNFLTLAIERIVLHLHFYFI